MPRRSTPPISPSRRSSARAAATAQLCATRCGRPTIRACAGRSSSTRKAIPRSSRTWYGSSTSRRPTHAAEGGHVAIKVIKSGIPRPLANYNEAFVVGDLVFAAGQLASDFKTGVPPEARKKDGFPFYGSDIELQTAYILENMKKTFEAAGSSLDHVVKAQVFLTDLRNFHGFDTVWKRYFKVPPPRTTIGCTGLLVKDTLVEIDLIAYVPRKGLKHEVVTASVPRPLANYNEAFVVGDLVFTAGQLASDFKTGVPPEARKKDGFPFYGSDIERQTAYILENLKKT